MIQYMKQNKIGKDFAVFGIWGDSTAAEDLHACTNLWVVLCAQLTSKFLINHPQNTKSPTPKPLNPERDLFKIK